jgi:hypothetical protein
MEFGRDMVPPSSCDCDSPPTAPDGAVHRPFSAAKCAAVRPPSWYCVNVIWGWYFCMVGWQKAKRWAHASTTNDAIAIHAPELGPAEMRVRSACCCQLLLGMPAHV